ncbi:Zn-ribbon domain-containing OB-fold protein [Secundilactobacillus malefermentans]|uniref:Zn-ribbon domain-containing OB-fold protein n=1 Tax=Secundilactobacillus malefermentans TaxID=176292 RepID=UPI0011CB6FA6|nr:zinc ribbon domain-containing protein [Secundilactobacillus malefermentans]QEA32109.1 hypothetical protein FGL90_07895 [Secundilactobacillus malefermentans]
MYKLRPILKTYYDSLEDGKVLGMKCEECGDVVWPPLPTCQKCGSYHVDWFDLGTEAVIDEIRYEDSSVGGDYTFRKANDYFVDKETPYCICVGHWPKGTEQFHAALYGVTEANKDELISKLPLPAKVHFIQLDGGFKTVGFELE